MPTLAPSCAHVFLRLAGYVPAPSIHLKDLCSSVNAKVIAGLRVDITEAASLVEEIARTSGDLDIGLNAYELFKPAQLNAQLYAIMSSENLGEALRVIVKYSTLLADGMPISYVQDENSLTLQFLRVESMSVTRQYIDCCLTTMIGITHWLLPWERPTPAAVTFSYEAPADQTKLKLIFGNNLQFSSALNTITYANHDLTKPLDTANPKLKIYHLSQINELLSERQNKISPIVKNLIFTDLNSSHVTSLKKAARELNFSSRTLQGRLGEEKTCFKDLLDECRRELACELLRNSKITFLSIAEKLSFSSASSFHKACTRWFGCSPGAYRSRQS
ncbi:MULTISPECIES: AraC family transcriptional regulator [Pseudomonas syringae group]|uniref:Helix-turn-helix domain-containing protein n=2 Tax=Pseudomonas syringae group TaxID=136849 RepID=A0ABX6HE44_9PSED|nr:AraC family transcriptional regulator [Pseudomonas asturiensis]QHF03825.1 helix-turn-helix domain-containing protein [Pseudomonas asturiensis]